MAVQEGLRFHFGSNRRNLFASHSTCANIKKAHSLIKCLLSMPIEVIGWHQLLKGDIDQRGKEALLHSHHGDRFCSSSPRLYYLPPFFGFFPRKLYPHAVHAYNHCQAFLCHSGTVCFNTQVHCAKCVSESVSNNFSFRGEATNVEAGFFASILPAEWKPKDLERHGRASQRNLSRDGEISINP